MSKVCTCCSTEKPLTEFYGGVKERSYCIDCERKQARWRMYRPRNRLKTALRDSKKQAIKHVAYDDLTLDDVAYTFAINNNHCAYCGNLSNDLHLEHIVPLSRGGANSVANITVSCRDCNIHKKDKALLTYINVAEVDTQALMALINRVALRDGITTNDVITILQTQQNHYFMEDAQKMIMRSKAGAKQNEKDRERQT